MSTEDLEEQLRLAMDKALYYLGFKDRGSKQMREYLARKEFSEEVSNQVIERLQEYGYLNDEQYARRVVESQTIYKKKGKRAAAQKLWQLGIERELADSALGEIDEADEKASALFWVEKLWPKLKEDPKGKEKLFRRILSRGFSYDLARAAIEEGVKEEETID